MARLDNPITPSQTLVQKKILFEMNAGVTATHTKPDEALETAGGLTAIAASRMYRFKSTQQTVNSSLSPYSRLLRSHPSSLFSPRRFVFVSNCFSVKWPRSRRRHGETGRMHKLRGWKEGEGMREWHPPMGSRRIARTLWTPNIWKCLSV